MGIFADESGAYVRAGLSPLPIAPGKKRPCITKWQQYCEQKVDENTLEGWKKEYGGCNIGLALGRVTASGAALIAIDIDDDELVDPVTRAVGTDVPSKRGKKGVTIFVLSDPTITNTKFKRMKDGTPVARPSVEILAKGSQTVIPPSIHPETGEPYVWLTTTLLDVGSKGLAMFTRGTLDEIAAICHEKDEHFKALNTMVWAGIDGGGNTHDTCVSAVANLVARGWEDLDIHSRIERAKEEACKRAGDTYDWPQSSKVIQGWIDSAREKGMTGKAQRKKQVPPERRMATWIIDHLGGEEKVVTHNGLIRSYNNGYWAAADVRQLERQIYIHNELIKKAEARNAIHIAATLTEDSEFGTTIGVLPRDDPKRQRVCLQNGTINLRTGELEQHDPDHQLMHQLPFSWDDKAECPVYDRVVAETFAGDEEAIHFWEEYAAHTLVDDNTFQRLLFLKGPGGNGKGTLARILRGMHDPNAIGSVSITDLNDERKRTSLIGKLLNISGEQSRLNLVSDTYLKKITGSDPIDVRLLYGETQNNVVLSVRFLELVNDMPATSDNSYALRRRIVILPCPNKVTSPDMDLDRKLLAERPGILRRWVRAIDRLYRRGDFLVPKCADAEVEDYMMENDPVAYWLQERTEKCGDGTPGRDLYADYSEWIKLMGFKQPYSEIFWGKKLTAKGFPSYPKRLGDMQIRMRALRIKKGMEART